MLAMFYLLPNCMDISSYPINASLLYLRQKKKNTVLECVGSEFLYCIATVPFVPVTSFSRSVISF